MASFTSSTRLCFLNNEYYQAAFPFWGEPPTLVRKPLNTQRNDSHMKILPIVTVACLMASPSYADLHVQFLEGAPKDQFVLTNKGLCEIENAEVTIDLSGSDAGLIFDVTEAGSGVEVFQPFKVTVGAKHLVGRPSIMDGDQFLTLSLTDFPQNQSVAFTIDIDDTAGGREITVSDNEMRGATISVLLDGNLFSAALDQNSEAQVNLRACIS